MAKGNERNVLDRRSALKFGLAAIGLSSGEVKAQTAALSIPLWPGLPPGMARAGVELDPRDIPSLQPLISSTRANGSALLLVPGGAFAVEMQEDIELAARLFGAHGIACFGLHYRLPSQNWKDRADVPIQDALRAVRILRANAVQYGINANRIGIMGFSSGGYVAAAAATRFASRVYEPVDTADLQDARPNFAVALYPVITMGDGAHIFSKQNLLGLRTTASQVEKYSLERGVPNNAAPTFVCLGADDQVVPPLSNGIAFFLAMRAANVPSELHAFEEGAHGFGVKGAVNTPGGVWPDLFLRWATRHGFLAI